MMHRIHWAAPAPTWIAAAAQANPADRATAIRRPMLLRFASDAFMQEYAAILDDDPERLAEIEARAGETWREYPGAPALPAAGATLLATPVRRKLGAHFKRTAVGQLAQTSFEAAQLMDVKKTSEETAAGRPPVLKLFQSSHQRFYLVAASLVCRFPGLPDHFVDPAKQERAWFVVRRLVPKDDKATTFAPTESEEHAFVTSDTGSTWVPVLATGDAPPALVRGEEKLPMFGTPYIGRDGVARRLFAGLVPVSRREAYMGAPRGKPATPSMTEEEAERMGAFPEPVDSRVVMLVDDVIGPWRNLLAQVKDLNETTLSAAGTARTPLDLLDEPPYVALLKRDQILHCSWLVLLDFAAYLRRYLPAVSAAIDARTPAGLTTDAERDLYTKLTQVTYSASKDDPKTTITLAQALVRFDLQHRTTLEVGPTLLSNNNEDRAHFASLPRFAFGAINWPPVDGDKTRERKFSESYSGHGPNLIKDAVEAALKERPPDARVPPPPAAAYETIPVNRTTRFVLRCVLDRPRCGAVAPPILSEPTEPFAMAAYFDPDAPARQMRISLPVDTSPAGLRKFQKGASFLISDVLCGQVSAVRKLTLGDLVLSVLPWPFHKDLPEPDVTPCQDGMVCSLSIPIVTLCALILLIIIVILFNTFFFWLPWLISCFPLPLKAKEQA